MLKNKKHSQLLKGCYVGGKRLPPGEKKIKLNVAIKEKYVDQLKSIKNYSRIVEKLIADYLENQNKD